MPRVRLPYSCRTRAARSTSSSSKATGCSTCFPRTLAKGDNPMRMGKCPHCEYSPVAPGSAVCPGCGARNPNPGLADRVIGRASLIGGLGGVMVGGVGGLFFPGKTDNAAVGAVAGGIGGGLVGLMVGLVVGLVLASGAWVAGKR